MNGHNSYLDPNSFNTEDYGYAKAITYLKKKKAKKWGWGHVDYNFSKNYGFIISAMDDRVVKADILQRNYFTSKKVTVAVVPSEDETETDVKKTMDNLISAAKLVTFA